jgi:hypothetical protein
MGLGIGAGHTMKPYMLIGASEKSSNSRVRRQAENEEGGINKDKNTLKNYNIIRAGGEEVIPTTVPPLR